MRTSVEVVRSAYATALEGFALPYGDITVGGWRNTPYVVIQNVGAYLDIPRFLDSEHRIDNAADAEAYLARLQSYANQLDGELGRMQAARAGGLVPPSFLIDKALAEMTLSAKGAREGGALVESIERRTKRPSQESRHWADRALAIATKEVAPALERQLAELQAQRAVATNDAGISARPHGEEFYRWALKASTTTAMSPDEVHEMGRTELQRLHAQMDAILKEIGYSQGSVAFRKLVPRILRQSFHPFADGPLRVADLLQDVVHPRVEALQLAPAHLMNFIGRHARRGRCLERPAVELLAVRTNRDARIVGRDGALRLQFRQLPLQRGRDSPSRRSPARVPPTCRECSCPRSIDSTSDPPSRAPFTDSVICANALSIRNAGGTSPRRAPPASGRARHRAASHRTAAARDTLQRRQRCRWDARCPGSAECRDTRRRSG